MKETLRIASEYAVDLIDMMALAVIVFGSLQAFFAVVKCLGTSQTAHDRRYIWIRYARWLVAGLTFQLASDIIETSITTGWEAVAKLGATAAIRTFLNYFLERDLADARERQDLARERTHRSPQEILQGSKE